MNSVLVILTVFVFCIWILMIIFFAYHAPRSTKKIPAVDQSKQQRWTLEAKPRPKKSQLDSFDTIRHSYLDIG